MQVIDWLISKSGRSTVIGNELRGIVAARAVAPLTVEIQTGEPDPILPKRMVGAFMVEPQAWASFGPDGFALHRSAPGLFCWSNGISARAARTPV